MILYNIILVRVALYLKKNKQEKQQTLNKVQPSSPLQKKKERKNTNNQTKTKSSYWTYIQHFL